MKSSALFQDGLKEFGPYAVVWDWRPHRVPIVPEMTQLLFGGKHFDVNGNQFYRAATNCCADDVQKYSSWSISSTEQKKKCVVVRP